MLITKDLSEVPLLEAFCATHSIALVAESFIRFSMVKAAVPTDMEVLFFGSKRAVDFFLLQADIPANCKIACIGGTTAAHLQQRGHVVNFAGTKAGDPESVAAELKTWLGNRKLHIALSTQSNQSISNALPAGQSTEFVVYETLSNPKVIEKPLDLLAFTSPSNLQAYLAQNTIASGTKLIAWGKTTEKALHQNHFQADAVLGDSSEAELVSILESFLH